ncbi:F-box/kelch-repeat protein At3g06240-like [Papaver somniferum]|uniref:F-box/kelch-repeat protein At3g06240-like n=1 Tax=Papaver somniferum TaxID=3469 RepID=UPI000E6FF684|nr:F-box/kelch-repeat protein At3g06240-like [Papaver somniferum]
MVAVEGHHNHPRTEHLEGHSMDARLTPQQVEKIAKYRRMSISPLNMLRLLKDDNKDNVSSFSTIYNAIETIKRNEWNDRQVMQQSFFFLLAREKSYALQKKTNKYDMTLLNIVGNKDIDNAPIKEIRYPVYCLTDKLKIFGSCNGLVCSRHCDGSAFVLPVRFRAISFPGYISFEYEFGYDALNQDYKYVEIAGSSTRKESEVDVYSLKSVTWRRIQYIPYLVSNGHSVSAPGVSYNGALHWISKSYSGNKRKVLIALDVGNESVQEIPQLENLGAGKFGAYGYVSVLDNCLGMLCSSRVDGYEVWMMKDYGLRESWTKLYTISTVIDVKSVRSVQYLRKMECLKNGEILLTIKQHEVSNLAGEKA